MYGIWNRRILVWNGMEWNGMEWKILIDMDYGKLLFYSIPFHSIACPALQRLFILFPNLNI